MQNIIRQIVHRAFAMYIISVVVLPYVKGVSESMRWILVPLKIRVCFKPHQTLRNLLSKPKNQLPHYRGVVWFTKSLAVIVSMSILAKTK